MASIMWFRRGLRLHGNPALLSAVQDGAQGFAAVYIFDPPSGDGEQCSTFLNALSLDHY